MTTTASRARSWHFVLSGGVGGLVGFALLELFQVGAPGQGGSGIRQMAFYFAGFGLAVGAALGVTAGILQRDRFRILYGGLVGLLLGGLAGFLGGASGQAIQNLFPPRYAYPSKVDLVIALDSSGSMSQAFFFGNDPWGERRKAAKHLVEHLSTSDRVAIVDFDQEARLLFPLTLLSSRETRRQAIEAIGQVDSNGGTNLGAGLATSLNELAARGEAGRPRVVIFLTDGEGDWQPGLLGHARAGGVVVHTVGLGTEVNAELLTQIATETGGRYYPVEQASALTALFEKIFQEQVVMTQPGRGVEGAIPLTSPWLLLFIRALSWAVTGLAIGAGQGVRENSREDLRACALGGLLGGALGGLAFNPLASWAGLGEGVLGRLVADVLVGAAIGGSMRFFQQKLVEESGKPTTTLIELLPARSSVPAMLKTSRPAPASPLPRPTVTAPPAPPIPSQPAPPPVAPPPPARPSLASFAQQYPEPARAMAAAHRSGHYRLSEIAAHFGVPASAVRRAIDEHRHSG